MSVEPPGLAVASSDVYFGLYQLVRGQPRAVWTAQPQLVTSHWPSEMLSLGSHQSQDPGPAPCSLGSGLARQLPEPPRSA